MFDWNDLRYFLAVARHRSTLAAGRALKLSQSTVQRRLAELERRIGRRLVKRHPTGYRLTELGEEMLPYAERVEQSVLAFEQHVDAAKRDVLGVIRVTCPEPLVYRITQSSLLERFHARYPALRVEFVMSDKYLDLAKGEADVALRSGDTTTTSSSGARSGLDLGRLCEPEVHRATRQAGPGRGPRAAFAGRLRRDDGQPPRREMAARGGAGREDRRPQQQRARGGLRGEVGGGDRRRCRRRSATPRTISCACSARSRSSRGSGASSTHPDLRRTPRVSAFFDFITGEIEALKPILTG